MKVLQVEEKILVNDNYDDSVVQTITDDEKTIDYEKIFDSQEFQQLLSVKQRFIVPLTVFYISYGMLLPFLAFYTDWLEVKVIGDITLAWVYGVSIVLMSLVIATAYTKRAEKFDKAALTIIQKEGL
jgi:uncharacterized membrane protein (DUF485 family)